MLNYLNQFLDVISRYVSFLFNLQIVQGVSIGSIFLVASFFWIITTVLWHR